jgi:hypothetical protein
MSPPGTDKLEAMKKLVDVLDYGHRNWLTVSAPSGRMR